MRRAIQRQTICDQIYVEIPCTQCLLQVEGTSPVEVEPAPITLHAYHLTYTTMPIDASKRLDSQLLQKSTQ